jgi:hypothetical protein
MLGPRPSVPLILNVVSCLAYRKHRSREFRSKTSSKRTRFQTIYISRRGSVLLEHTHMRFMSQPLLERMIIQQHAWKTRTKNMLVPRPGAILTDT